MKEKSLRKVVAQKESEDQWKELIWKLANASLLPSVDSVSLVMAFGRERCNVLT
jgi:hypothetical protein